MAGMTTIRISKELKHKIGEFGTKNDTYMDIIERMYKAIVEMHLAKHLMDDKDTVSIKEAAKSLGIKLKK
ncbi:hypothetical protein KY321_04560 [Candidatus Woesearchaeota archaeon]|nr:hypothetical protein [Candidatus Woesearchaeota archaeon]